VTSSLVGHNHGMKQHAKAAQRCLTMPIWHTNPARVGAKSRQLRTYPGLDQGAASSKWC